MMLARERERSAVGGRVRRVVQWVSVRLGTTSGSRSSTSGSSSGSSIYAKSSLAAGTRCDLLWGVWQSGAVRWWVGRREALGMSCMKPRGAGRSGGRVAATWGEARTMPTIKKTIMKEPPLPTLLAKPRRFPKRIVGWKAGIEGRFVQVVHCLAEP